jgi:thiol-disulfide isomerase/thioredoxin
MLIRHVISKFGPADPQSVLVFNDEDSFYERMDLAQQPKPIFVKFYEDTCPHCQKFKAVCDVLFRCSI